jgi:RHS repeat-associated protein
MTSGTKAGEMILRQDKFGRGGAGTKAGRLVLFLALVALGFCGFARAQEAKTVIRPGQSITMLADGRLLLLGGLDAQSHPTAAAYLIDGSEQATALDSRLQMARAGHTATLLPDGTVFVFGGVGADGQIVQAAELFNPATRSFSILSDVLAVPRAYHTATMLTDGTLLLAGGVAAGHQFPDDVQLWDFRTHHALSFQALLMTPRQGHTATLLADGSVRISGGADIFGHKVDLDEIYDPEGKRFRYANPATDPIQPDAAGAPRIMASVPEDGAQNVPIDALISIRFSRLLNVASVNADSVVLVGPDQNSVAITVTPAENGRLAFVIPKSSLQTGANYTFRITQVTDSTGEPLPDSTISFQTAGEPSEIGPDDAGASQWPATTATEWQQLRPLQAPPNVTALAGQVLKLNGWPLAHVTLEIEGGPHTQTDGTGRFLLQGVTPGHHVLWIDGATANHDRVSYGLYEVGATVLPNKTNVLNYTIWMTPLDMAHAVNIPSPTTREMVITNPAIPGLDLHLPAGTVITDRHGKVVRQLSITAIPLNKPPFPLPAGVVVPVYLTVQPGGSYVKVLNPGNGPNGARLVYPNTWNFSPGTPFDFWDYDADVKGWFIYGQGHVGPDGLSIAPDPGVVLYEFTGAMDGSPSTAPAIGDPDGPPEEDDGEPVHLSTGQFIYNNTDLSVPDVLPITFERTYIANDSRSRAFGIGSTHNYDIFTVGDVNPYTYQELILPNGSRVRFDRISPGTSWLDTIYVATTSGGVFYGAQMSWVINSSDPGGGHWKLVMKNGTVMTFPEAFQSTNPFCQALTSITDRYGTTVKLTRNSTCNLTKITSPNGRYINLTNDSQGRVTQAQDNIGRTVTYSYDAVGRLSTVTDANGGVTTYAYDDQNRMLTIQDPRNIVYLTNQYDSAGRVIQQTQADNSTYLFSWTAANAGQTHFFASTGGGGGGGATLVINGCWGNSGYNRYSSACGEGYMPLVAQVNVTDPRGYVRQVVFGQTGYATSDTHALGQPEQQTVTYAYYSDNLLKSVTDPLGFVTSFDYDALGNRTRVTRLDGTPGAVTSSFGYAGVFRQLSTITDPLGHSSSFGYDQNGNLTAATDALNHSTTRTYNSNGQVNTISDALNNTVQLGYLGGAPVSTTDPMSNVASVTPDGAGRIGIKTDAQGNTASYSYDNLDHVTQTIDGNGAVTGIIYDPNGNMLSLTDALNHTTSWTYDSMNRILTRTDPLLRKENFTYDLNGNMTSSTDRKGQVTSFTYDSLNRLNLVGFNAIVNGGNTTYESTISYTYDARNRVTQAVDSAGGTITKTYDDVNRLITETTPNGSVTYSYDTAGRLTSMTVAGQPPVSYTYDNADRLVQMVQGTSSVGFSYDNANRRASLTLPNGVVVSYAYDNNSRLTALTYQKNGNVLGNLIYSYDQVGRRTQIAGTFARTNLPGFVSSAVYDAANELTNWNGSALSYDANGNLLSDGLNMFTWNARNQAVALNGASLQYDALGRRTKNAAGKSFLFDGANPTQELSGSTVTANIWTGGVDELFQRSDNHATVFPLVDALGSVLALTDNNGNIQTSYTYDPFGNTSVSGQASANPSQFGGRENDGNGLYFLRARYYNTLLGRFISEDPAHAGNNFYVYAADSPTNLVDPYGLWPNWGTPPPPPPGNFTPPAPPCICPGNCSGLDDILYRMRHQDWAYNKKHHGHCARAVGHGLEAAGFSYIACDALNCGQPLLDRGFDDVTDQITNDGPLLNNPGNLQPGDIVVMQPTPEQIALAAAQHEDPPNGHIAIWDGSQWISDYLQKNFQPYLQGNTVINDYRFYRYPWKCPN